MRKHWLSITLIVAVVVGVAGGYWYVRTRILPYSARYNGNKQLSTTPDGVGGGTKTNAPANTNVAAKSVLLVALTATAPALLRPSCQV